jgi:hypothetical protein
MKFQEARGVVGVLLAFYPRVSLRSESVDAWATALSEFEAPDALAAVNELARASKFFPALAEVLDSTRNARTQRLPGLRGAAPAADVGEWYPFARFLAEHPEMRPRVEALEGSWVGSLFADILRREIELGRAA